MPELNEMQRLKTETANHHTPHQSEPRLHQFGHHIAQAKTSTGFVNLSLSLPVVGFEFVNERVGERLVGDSDCCDVDAPTRTDAVTNRTNMMHRSRVLSSIALQVQQAPRFGENMIKWGESVFREI